MAFIVAAIQIYIFVVIIRAIFSWLPERHRYNEFYRFVYAITEPPLERIRRVLPRTGGVDLSPIVLIILLHLLSYLLAAL